MIEHENIIISWTSYAFYFRIKSQHRSMRLKGRIRRLFSQSYTHTSNQQLFVEIQVITEMQS